MRKDVNTSGLPQDKVDFSISSSPLAFWAFRGTIVRPFRLTLCRVISDAHSKTPPVIYPVGLPKLPDNEWPSLLFWDMHHLPVYLAGSLPARRWNHIVKVAEKKMSDFGSEARSLMNSKIKSRNNALAERCLLIKAWLSLIE